MLWLLLLLLNTAPALAHSGRTNAQGCHRESATGETHCHNAAPIQSEPQQQPDYAAPWSVVSIGDGDTIRVSQGSHRLTVRLACIDAPERSQAPYGEESREHLKALLSVGDSASLRIVARDRYKRAVAEVFKGDSNINLQMVTAGQAVVYRQYLRNCDRDSYLSAEETASTQRLGYWQQDDPVMPWDWRKR